SPRGSVISTGEIDPQTRSALGRALSVEILAGDIDPKVLASIQQAADAGRYAELVATYIQYGRRSRGASLIEAARRAAKYRQGADSIKGAHPRHIEAIAELYAAYRLFLQWAIEQGLIDEEVRRQRLGDVRKSLEELGRSQAPHQAESKPGRHFLDLIVSALSS